MSRPEMTAAGRYAAAGVWTAALAGPVLLTLLLNSLGAPQRRDYVFGYLGLVAVLGVVRGFGPAMLAAVTSFMLVDYFFVAPLHTLTIADEQDIVNLLAFVATAAVVGVLASMRRRALMGAERLAQQLREANAALVRLNREQAAAAQAELRLARSEQQVRALQETDRLRRELLANVSHELRTPLGTILAESTDAGSLTAREAAAKMATVAEEARRLGRLVDDMLDMARIEGGALELDLQPVLLSDVVGAARERLALASPGREVTWEPSTEGIEVLADWDRLGQIFDNLLQNADRFGTPGTPITVSASEEEEGLVTVRVRDQGPGVPPDLRDRVFDRFVRGALADGRPAHGTGLGLAIVKGLVEAHAGSIALEEPADGMGGATFRFTVPKAP